MKRWLATFAMVAVCSVGLLADVTITQTSTVEGGPAAMSGNAPTPTITVSVKGQKGRMEIDVMGQHIITLIDLTTKQVTVLHPETKTAQIVSSPGSLAAGATAGGTTATTAAGTSAVDNVAQMIKDMSMAPTGRTQTIDGYKCDEYSFSTTMDMSSVGGPQIPPEAAEMLRGTMMSMKGSFWVTKDAPGAAEYVAFQKASAAANLSTMTNGAGVPGMDKMMKAVAGLNGMAYLTEMNMTVEGSGQLADMMRQMGGIKVVTRVTSIKTDPLAADLFEVPAGFTVSKQ